MNFGKLITSTLLIFTCIAAQARQDMVVTDENNASVDSVFQGKAGEEVMVSKAANPDFDNGFLGKFFFGRHYRQTWITPVSAPVFKPKQFRGGLEVLKLGGGNQTKTLRLINDNEVQYNLRTIDKFPGKTIPKAFRGTWVNKIVKDQISTAHPYAFITLPRLSEAIGIHHTHPQLFYVSRQTEIGDYDYAENYGNSLFMIEVRPDEDLSDFTRFGYTENAVGTEKLFEELYEDNDNEVDTKALVRARLFDIVIGDWDRHEDQWRWAEYEKDGKGSIYQPIPRDRDQVYAKMDGLIPQLVSSRMFIRRIGHFDYKESDVIGMNWSARNLDRNLLAGATEETWTEQAAYIQKHLTDEVIEAAIQDMPSAVYEISGPEIIGKLKSRRDDLIDYALQYYHFLAKEVRIAISNKHELYLINRLNDEATRVQVFKTKKDGEVMDLLLDRTFYTHETKELWLYGLDGNDEFRVTGDVDKGITIRIVGGHGEDTFLDQSRVQGLAKKTIFYDNISDFKNTDLSSESRVHQSDKAYIHDFSNLFYEYDRISPRLSFEINPDDGLFLGAGIYLEDNAFRKSPASTHLFTANWAFRTSGFNAAYEGRFNALLAHNWDLKVDADGHNAKFAFNYFGQGNNSVNDQPIDYYRVNLERFELSALAIRNFGKTFSLGFGPTYEYANIQEAADGILDVEGIDQDLVDTDAQHILGARVFADLNYTDHPAHPSKGIRWYNEVNYTNGGEASAINFTRLTSELSLYYTPKWPFRVTFATRFGVATNTGDYLFYQSNFLGGQQNLRGFRRFRFAGRGSAYQNTEARVKLFQLRNVVLNGEGGLIGFMDHGRVWSDESNESNNWQRTFGPGAYLTLYDYVVLSAHYGITDSESNFFLMKMGFLF